MPSVRVRVRPPQVSLCRHKPCATTVSSCIAPLVAAEDAPAIHLCRNLMRNWRHDAAFALGVFKGPHAGNGRNRRHIVGQRWHGRERRRLVRSQRSHLLIGVRRAQPRVLLVLLRVWVDIPVLGQNFQAEKLLGASGEVSVGS